mmetsp:Transcript_2178/g.3237  ORF Transcript_2178/g.3237 Transcript_2178/m.3237 type:complete len:329 (-) Transcript_2178:1639-2625(-)
MIKPVLTHCRRGFLNQQGTTVLQKSSVCTLGRLNLRRNALAWEESSAAGCGRNMSTFPQDTKNQYEKEKRLETPSTIYSEFTQKQIPKLMPSKYPGVSRLPSYRKQAERDVPLLETVWGKSPILNVSPLIKFSQSNSGRSELLNILRNDKKHRSYALAGHGVPQQLLQDHVNMACTFLKDKKTKEVSLHGFDQFQVSDSIWIFDKNINRTGCWNPQNDFLQSQMELYLTVMNRLSSLLGMVLYEDDDKRNFPTALSHWNVTISRMHANSPNCAPLIPMVEWMPKYNIDAPGDVSIRLYGFYTPPNGDLRRKRKIPLMLNFVASFRGGS